MRRGRLCRQVLASDTRVYIVMESVTGGDLFERIIAATRLSEDQARVFFRQLLSGMEYCHSQAGAATPHLPCLVRLSGPWCLPPPPLALPHAGRGSP